MNANLAELGKKFVELKQKHEALKKQLAEVNAEWEAVEAQMLEGFVEEGVSGMKLDGIGNFSMRVENYLNVNAENKPRFYDYLQASGNGGLLKLDVNPRTLSAFLKEHFATLESQHIADGLDVVEARTKALDFLNSHGANYFTKRTLSLRQA